MDDEYNDFIRTFSGALQGREQEGQEDWQDILYALMRQENQWKQEPGQATRDFQRELVDPIQAGLSPERRGALSDYAKERSWALTRDPSLMDSRTADMERQLFDMIRKSR